MREAFMEEEKLNEQLSRFNKKKQWPGVNRTRHNIAHSFQDFIMFQDRKQGPLSRDCE